MSNVLDGAAEHRKHPSCHGAHSQIRCHIWLENMLTRCALSFETNLVFVLNQWFYYALWIQFYYCGACWSAHFHMAFQLTSNTACVWNFECNETRDAGQSVEIRMNQNRKNTVQCFGCRHPLSTMLHLRMPFFRLPNLKLYRSTVDIVGIWWWNSIFVFSFCCVFVYTDAHASEENSEKTKQNAENWLIIYWMW